MGFRPQGPQQGGYGQQQQPELRPGATVISADGAWRGTVVDLAGQGAETAVRVQWEGYGLTYVTVGMLAYDNGRWVVRSEQQGQQAVQAAQQQAAQQQAAPQPQPQPAPNPQAQAAQASGYGQQGQQGQQAPQPQAGYGAGAVGAGRAGAAQPDDITMLPGSGPRPQPQPQPQMPQEPQRAAVQPSVANDEVTRLPQMQPRPQAPQPQPQQYAPQPQAQLQPAQDRAYYPDAPSLPAVLGGRQEQIVIAPHEQRVVVPIIEEQIEAHPEWREAGNVRVNVRTEEVPQTITQDVQREEVTVERVAVGRVLADGEELAPRQEGEVFIVPVIVEEVVVTTRRVLAEEVRITRGTVTVTQSVDTTVRQQRVEVDGGDLADRVHDRASEE